MSFINRWAVGRIIGKIFKDTRLSNLVELANFINLVKCDSVQIEGLTNYYEKLTLEQKRIADKTFRLILAYLLNRAGIKINYEEIK